MGVRFAERLRFGALIAAALPAVAGACSKSPVTFEPNRICMRQQKLAENLGDFQKPALKDRIAEMQRLMQLLFGDPDMPRVPELPDVQPGDLLDLRQLQRAAGPAEPSAGPNSEGVSTGGLYRRHCAQCHGISGDGLGPLARWQNPYPRDFRRGLFKFKSTALDNPPLDADLRRVISEGIPDTAMPAFNSLAVDELDALVQYVKYLAIRGMFERRMIMEVAWELEPDRPLVQWHQQHQNPDRFQQSLAPWKALLQEVATRWMQAKQAVIPVPPVPENWPGPQHVAVGRELFYSTATNCAQCHGNTALGDGQTDEYDQWAKELEPTNPAALKDYLALGALPPRRAIPRNLRLGVYRGGGAPEDFYRYIANGITGTTMPTIATELTRRQLWSLVAFVRHLPDDPINNATSDPHE